MSEVRDSLRAAILASRPLSKKLVEFFGQQIELRQPSLADVIAGGAQSDNQSALISSLIRYAYIPNTDERVFDEADAEVLKSQPFGADFVRVSKALEELTQVNFPSTKDSSSSDPTSTS